MHIRSVRERIIQTLFYEAGGLLLVTPAYGWVTGHTTSEALTVLIAVSIATMSWAAFHNTIFDYIEAAMTGRLASKRSQLWRLVHACSTEASSIVVTTPVIMLVGGYGLWDALLIDIGLTLAYAAYAYVYHQVFDLLRPMAEQAPVMALADGAAPRVGQRRAVIDPSGLHIMIDAYDAPLHLLSDEQVLRTALTHVLRAVTRDATQPQVFWGGEAGDGYCACAVSPSGEFSIRTFPWRGFMTLDLHLRGSAANAHAVADVLKRAFRISRADVYCQERGLRCAPPVSDRDRSGARGLQVAA
jgi:uncharacterized membrane protein/S-adenosylmethionine/arginine decarboxylase-like enzyme